MPEYWYIDSSLMGRFLFPVPSDEDDKDKSVWFLNHDYLENMYGMFKKVNGKIAESNIYVRLIAVEIE